MFHGSIPTPLRSIIYEHAGTWPGDDVYVGCSGNFTIERVLYSRFGKDRRVHGNDIQGYSCALGWWLADQELDYRLKPEYLEQVPWLEPYTQERTDLLATIMLGTRFLGYVGKHGDYHRRVMVATELQWERMHSKTVAKLQGLETRIGSFYAGDVRDYLRDAVPTEAPVVMFPPFYAKDYQSQFASIDEAFDWPVPDFRNLDEDGKEEIIAQVQDRPNWMLGLHIEREALRDRLVGVVQTANRGLPIFVYAGGGPSRIVQPRQILEPLPMRKLGPTEDLGDKITVHPINMAQFCMVRSEFMSKTILPGSPLEACAVAVDGRLIGAFAFNEDKYDTHGAYLLSDFPVSWTRYRRLSKLIVMVACSKEVQHLMQRRLSRKINTWATTAFSDRPNSAKYGRGIPGCKLTKRQEPGSDGIHRYQLQYDGVFGRHTLAETLDLWKRKHGHDLKDTTP
ncbi:putative antirestriction adenine methyltransferase [Streptomyces sp. NBC_00425]|uniref:putative antirestriction adenine methyltransferase n=1 Tax=Streptomyces sp. NBC_00425 TaxID=2975740 RepID=UPI002E1C0458